MDQGKSQAYHSLTNAHHDIGIILCDMPSMDSRGSTEAYNIISDVINSLMYDVQGSGFFQVDETKK